MLVAQQKRKENIAEYILYLYQIEDIIRAFKFDMTLIENQLLPSYNADEETSGRILDWYSNLVLMMEKEDIREKGHLQFLSNLIHDVNDLHLKLLADSVNNGYMANFNSVAGIISELKEKNKSADNDVQIGLDTIYGYLVLKMKKAEISEETLSAVKQLSKWLAVLSNWYKELEKGKVDLQ